MALGQWCMFRYKLYWKKLQLYIRNKKKKQEEEKNALNLRKEHMRKQGS